MRFKKWSTRNETDRVRVFTGRPGTPSRATGLTGPGFFRVCDPLSHGASVYNGHYLGAVTLISFAERLALALSLPVIYDLGLSQVACKRDGGSSAGAPGARPPVWKYSRVYFWKFWLHNKRKLYCDQHAMITICILFSFLITKA